MPQVMMDSLIYSGKPLLYQSSLRQSKVCLKPSRRPTEKVNGFCLKVRSHSLPPTTTILLSHSNLNVVIMRINMSGVGLRTPVHKVNKSNTICLRIWGNFRKERNTNFYSSIGCRHPNHRPIWQDVQVPKFNRWSLDKVYSGGRKLR